ncbi:acyl-CoA dehydrogenase [Paraburkholderia sp. CNPSo 3272]|uniref:acyl-CoA dehydrogenase family protein n=1 Tax=Paraburkholderia sp. CNPSo 3272 TaxID=2940931 RepID=UPI0020B83482|nr:acyl-CoA dehydrogenase family protein [Paraburkholderia sp. CNPSo 3272]MCP3725217.1 acyl-CoA dehydrogenase [Paraburkholderia sp. CNPSo 3272]
MSATNQPIAVHKLGPLGAEPELSEMGQMVQQTVHRFAEEVMRPTGIQLDRMTPEQVIAPGSPYWEARNKIIGLGFGVDGLLELEPAERAKTMCILFEELGWGDAGLAITHGAGLLPALLSAVFGNTFCRSLTPDDKLGCWAITEPDHGSDMLDANGMIFHPQGTYGRPNCVATLRGDEVIINGQKSAWVSNGIAAEVCILYCAADSGEGVDTKRGAVVIVPLDAKGVSRGKPLDKIGQRALNQGELFFENVRLSKDHVLAGPDQYLDAVYAIHTFANAIMGAVFTGTARAAFELAHAYAHERKQGGLPIIRHQSVASRLFHMFRKVEAARALSQRVVHYNFTAQQPSLHAAMTSKITATQTAFEVANDALQIFCGNGLTREYPIEKIWRDARASLIEDGCNEVLAIKGGYYLIDPELL